MNRFLESIDRFDQKFSNFLFRNIPKSFIIHSISKIGSIISVCIYYILVVFILNESYVLLIQSFFSFFLSTSFVFILKFSIKRHRKNYGSSQFTIKWDPYSFPSGHISRIIAINAPFYSKTWIIWCVILISCFVSIARIYKGYHYLSDCIMGGVIGMISAVMSFYLIPFR